MPNLPHTDTPLLTPRAGEDASQTAARYINSASTDKLHAILARALRIADAAVMTDIECNAVAAGRDEAGAALYDLRPMVDPREVPPQVQDMHSQAIDWALERGLIVRHSQRTPLTVRINRHLVP
jgi:hypothetical protein